ncbi:16S rRNA (guanine(527)-N(7))-methyltransferase RsmG [Gammaproteobacteria bacterium]|nr:16S rRNA (guanine(527)-N(7))-methyltransferase RsmG [Gammaproteobacteria bacterium]
MDRDTISLPDFCMSLLASIHVDLEDDKIELLIKYTHLVNQWNQHHNLTSVRNPHGIMHRHIFDSLTILPYLMDANRIVDLGSGAGFPGIPLAIIRPSMKVALLDCHQKKISFLRHVLSELGVKNAGVVGMRAEEYHPEKPFDTLVSRAFSSIDNILSLAPNMVEKSGQVIIMKGVYPSSELVNVTHDYDVHPVHAYENKSRHVVVVSMDQS